MASAVASGVRDVEIAALSPRQELAAVLRAATIVVVAVALYLGAQARAPRGETDTAARNLLPFQSLIQGHVVAEQQMFRMLQVALLEAQRMRSANGAWPDVSAMAEQGIDPFVPDPTNKGARYSWRALKNGLTVHYVGLPDRPGVPAWLVMVQEPDPAAPPEPYQDDEEHARLLDGTVVHVSIWRHAGGATLGAGPVRVPQAEGWMQVFAAGPSSTH